MNKQELIEKIADKWINAEPIVNMIDEMGWLRNPDQVPGRTITESDYSDISEWARNYRTRGHEGRAVLSNLGITVVPDPPSTNAERLGRLYREWISDKSIEDSFGVYLDRHGVRAPEAGGDDEH